MNFNGHGAVDDVPAGQEVQRLQAQGSARDVPGARVKIYPCQMTMDLFGLNKEDLIDGLEDPVGAATMLQLATEADSTLFI